MGRLNILFIIFYLLLSGCAVQNNTAQENEQNTQTEQTAENTFAEYHNAIVGCVVGTLITFNPLVCAASAGVAYSIFDTDK